jgi:hypothetical protein
MGWAVEKTRRQLTAAAQHAKQQIAAGAAKPMEEGLAVVRSTREVE